MYVWNAEVDVEVEVEAESIWKRDVRNSTVKRTSAGVV
jgi:hypothetical protein